MKLKTLDGFEYQWKKQNEKAQGSVSELHKNVRDILKTSFPILSFMEEVPIMVLKNRWLYFDFYIPLFNTAIEVHGEQHYKYVPYFHKDIHSYMQYRKNDMLKVDFCKINNIEIIELKYDEPDSWRSTIVRHIKTT